MEKGIHMKQQQKKAFTIDDIQERSEILRYQIDHFWDTFGVWAAPVVQDLYDPSLQVGTVEIERALVADLLQFGDKLEEGFKVGREGDDG